MTLGYALLDGVAVWAGGKLGSSVSSLWLNRGAGGLFIVFGVIALGWGEHVENEGRRWIERFQKLGPFVVSLITISASEVGDRTQIATAVLAADTRDPWTIYLGALSALASLNLLTVWIGEKLASRIPSRWVHRLAAGLFIAAGIWMIIQARP